MSKMKKWMLALILLDVVIIAIAGTLVYFVYFHNKLDYKEYKGEENIELNFEGSAPYMEDIIADINNRTGTCYSIKFVQGLNGGQTRLISNIIEIDPRLTRESFAWVYVHEIFHHKFFTGNERFVEFETFKFLYESGSSFYKYSALYLLKRMNGSDIDYDARFYIYKYLKEKGDI